MATDSDTKFGCLGVIVIVFIVGGIVNLCSPDKATLNSPPAQEVTEKAPIPQNQPSAEEQQRRTIFSEYFQAVQPALDKAGSDPKKADAAMSAVLLAVAKRHGLAKEKVFAIVQDGMSKGWLTAKETSTSTPAPSKPMQQNAEDHLFALDPDTGRWKQVPNNVRDTPPFSPAEIIERLKQPLNQYDLKPPKKWERGYDKDGVERWLGRGNRYSIYLITTKSVGLTTFINSEDPGYATTSVMEIGRLAAAIFPSSAKEALKSMMLIADGLPQNGKRSVKHEGYEITLSSVYPVAGREDSEALVWVIAPQMK